MIFIFPRFGMHRPASIQANLRFVRQLYLLLNAALHWRAKKRVTFSICTRSRISSVPLSQDALGSQSCSRNYVNKLSRVGVEGEKIHSFSTRITTKCHYQLFPSQFSHALFKGATRSRGICPSVHIKNSIMRLYEQSLLYFWKNPDKSLKGYFGFALVTPALGVLRDAGRWYTSYSKIKLFLLFLRI